MHHQVHHFSPGALPPARLLVEADAEGSFADDLVRQHRVRGMEATSPNISVESLELARLEHAAATGRCQRKVDNTFGRLHAVVLGGDDLHWPGSAMIDSVRPVRADLV